MTRITFISDSHNRHKQISSQLPGGDIIIHSGDITSMGYHHEIVEFSKWFHHLPGYKHKVMIAGNHDSVINNKDRVDSLTPIVQFLGDIELNYFKDSKTKH